jgi:enoyl-CoA hydratase/carnithine racemase
VVPGNPTIVVALIKLSFLSTYIEYLLAVHYSRAEFFPICFGKTPKPKKEIPVQGDLLLVKIENSVCTLTLNRPEKKNSLLPELVESLLDVLERLATDDAVRVVVLRGFGEEAFCSGYDIRSLPNKISDDVREKLKNLNPVENLFKAVVNFPFPIIAMINGVAFGAGCELSVCCDIRIGADDTRMGMPPAKLGLTYPWTGLQRFIQVLGLKSTRELFYTGRTYEGHRLKELGLVDYLLPRNELEAFTYQMAAEIATNAPLALKGTKRILNLLLNSNRPSEQYQREAETITEAAFLSEDLKEGRLAFLEKRKPKFKGE